MRSVPTTPTAATLAVPRLAHRSQPQLGAALGSYISAFLHASFLLALAVTVSVRMTVPMSVSVTVTVPMSVSVTVTVPLAAATTAALLLYYCALNRAALNRSATAATSTTTHVASFVDTILSRVKYQHGPRLLPAILN